MAWNSNLQDNYYTIILKVNNEKLFEANAQFQLIRIKKLKQCKFKYNLVIIIITYNLHINVQLIIHN